MVATGAHPPVVRCYRPLATVAFGRRDGFLPGFSRAGAAARRHGFDPVIRAAGGRAAAYEEGCLVFDEIMPERDSMGSVHERFAGERSARRRRSEPSASMRAWVRCRASTARASSASTRAVRKS